MTNDPGAWLIWPLQNESNLWFLSWAVILFRAAVVLSAQVWLPRAQDSFCFSQQLHLHVNKLPILCFPHRKACFGGAELRGWAQPCSVGTRSAPLAGLQSRGQRRTFQCHLASGWPAAAPGGGRLHAVLGQRIPPPAACLGGRTPSSGRGGGLQLRERQRPRSPDQPNCKCSTSE